MPDLAFISLGSNIHPEVHLPEAVARLSSIGHVLRVSCAYRNPAVGPTAQPEFVNAAALVETALDPDEIRARLRSIEGDLGRIRQADKFAPRTLDLDLCYLDGVAREFDGWVLPDREADRLPHLAIPLAELMPEFKHPKTGETLETIAQRLLPEAALRRDPSIALTQSHGPPSAA